MSSRGLLFWIYVGSVSFPLVWWTAFYARTLLLVNCQVVNMHGCLVITRHHGMCSWRKLDTWKLPASRTFWGQVWSTRAAGKPKFLLVVPDLWKSPRGRFWHAASEFVVKHNQMFQPGSKNRTTALDKLVVTIRTGRNACDIWWVPNLMYLGAF